MLRGGGEVAGGRCAATESSEHEQGWEVRRSDEGREGKANGEGSEAGTARGAGSQGRDGPEKAEGS